MSNKNQNNPSKKEKSFDLYANKRKIQKEVRKIKNQILGTDTVDGSTFQRFYGEATKTRRALKIEMFGSKSKASKYGDDTSIEKFVEEILIESGVEFKKQKAIRYINTDYYIPSLELAIEVCGDYWHANPKLYPKPKNNIQRKNIEKDRISKEIIRGEGISRLEIWEDDIKNKPELVKEKLLFILSKDKPDCVTEISSHDW